MNAQPNSAPNTSKRSAEAQQPIKYQMTPQRYIVSCDWLSLSCEAPTTFVLPSVGSVYEHGVYKFTACDAKEKNPYYGWSRRFTYKGQDAFLLFASPRHPSSHPCDCQVKVCNRLLYSAGWDSLLTIFLTAAHLKIKHLQRIDICADFNKFSSGRNPAQFIRDYFSKPRVSRASFIRRGSNKFRTFGQKRLGLVDYETLSFGTRNSPVQVNLYNKSRELCGKDKPYIRDMWQANGLDVDNVWRVEFSLNPQGMMLHDLKADYITEVTFDMAGVYTRLSALFTTFAERYFKFYYVTKEDEKLRRKVEDLIPVQLFDYTLQSEYVPVSLCRKANTGERERRAAAVLQHELDYSQTLSPEEAKCIRGALKVLNLTYRTKAVASSRVEDDVLRDFVVGVTTLPDIYSDKSHRTRVNRWLQVLRQKRYSDKYDEFCKAMEYLDGQAEGFMESLKPVLDTFDPDVLGL